MLLKQETRITPYHFKNAHNIGKDKFKKVTGSDDNTKKLVVTTYTGKFKRGDIEKIVKNINDRLKEKGANILACVNVKYATHWMPGRFYEVGSAGLNVPSHSLYEAGTDIIEPGYFKQFSIAYINKPSKKGGAVTINKDPLNDCLFDCLVSALPSDTMPWKDAAEFKEFIGISRREAVDIKHLPNIEKKLKNYKINLTGDFIKPSFKRAPYEIKIKLCDGHYVLNNQVIKRKWDPKKEYDDMCFYEYTDSTKKQARLYMIRKDGHKGKYALLETKQLMQLNAFKMQRLKKGNELLSLEESINYFISYADEIKQLTCGEINFYKTETVHNTALEYFYRLTGNKINTELIEQDESHWINQCSVGGIIYSDKEYVGNAYKYDYVSHYPAIMCDEHMTYPMKRGVFSRLTAEEFNNSKFLSIGIYRFKVHATGINARIFRVNKFHYYTQIDFALALKLGFQMELIVDDTPNALIYSSDKCIKGHQVFGDYVSKLFPLKNKKVEIAKLLLNILWGSLCETNSTVTKFRPGQKSLFIPENSTIISVCDIFDSHKQQIKTVNTDVYFVHDFARIKPFILSKGRSKIASTILPHVNELLLCKIDSMVLSSKQQIKTGTDLGDLRYEGQCNQFSVTKSGKIKGDFIID